MEIGRILRELNGPYTSGEYLRDIDQLAGFFMTGFISVHDRIVQKIKSACYQKLSLTNELISSMTIISLKKACTGMSDDIFIIDDEEDMRWELGYVVKDLGFKPIEFPLPSVAHR